MMWVIDASVAIRWFIKEEVHVHADRVLERIVDDPEGFAVPELFAFEVYSVLQRLHPNGLHAFRRGLLPLLHSGLFRQPMTEDLAVKGDYFVQKGLTGYDACYAALSKDLKGLWLTFDEQAHRLIQQEGVSCLLSEAMPKGWEQARG